MPFKEKFDPTDNIKAILDAYPFSIGLFREILQNSDDAQATKQVFLLDCRTHSQDDLKIHHPRLTETQGPALLAYNDSEFQEQDWEALQTVHSSSKRDDPSKIGKYGIGFRSCYHITDYPQIISNNKLAIFDPQYNVFKDGGMDVALDECGGYRDVISAFGGILGPSHVKGTVLRFPLRTDTGGRISSKIVTAGEMESLLKVFAKEELDITLLFLQHISEIEISLIDEAGQRILYMGCKIFRKLLTMDTDSGDNFRLLSCNVVTAGREPETTASWLILFGDFSFQGASQILSGTMDFCVTEALHNNKLRPKMALAIERDPGHACDRGRLFTFLPLPISTAFPIHVHGLFSLTQSRQNLRNVGEKKGVAKGSNDQVLLEWNNLMFNFYLPKLWSRLFRVLSDYTPPSLIQAWPKPQPDVKCGDSLNWKDLPQNLAREVVRENYSVWPVVDSRGLVNHLPLKEVYLLSEDSRHLPVLPILAKSGVNVSKIPAHLYNLLSDLREEHADISFLEPCSLAQHLREHRDFHKLTLLSSPDKTSLLEYLLSDNQLQNIVELPLVSLPSKQYATLSFCSSPESKRTLLSKVDFEVFESLDRDAIALHILPESVARLLRTEGPTQLNVQSLENARVVHYLGSQELPSIWIVKFWSWATRDWKDRDGLFARLRESNFQIIPCTDSILRQISDIVFQPPSNTKLEVAFRKLNISFVSRDLSSSVMDFLNEKRCVRPLHDVDTLLHNVSTSLDLDSEESAMVLEHFLERPLLQLSPTHLLKLYQLPIFPLLKPQRPSTDHVISGISGEVKGIQKDYISVVINNGLLPPVTNISFLDLSPPNDNLLLLLSPLQRPLTIPDLLELSLDNFQSQPVHFQYDLIRYMTKNLGSISPDTIDRLKSIAFLRNRAGNLRAPADLIDPSSSIVELYPPGSEWLPSQSRDDDPLIEEVIRLGLLQKTLSTRLVNERIKYVASTSDDNTIKFARSLLTLIKSENFDCSQVHIDPEAKWLPSESGLSSPRRSRDPGMYALGRELFDEVLDVVVSVPRRLRERIGCWSSTIPFSILLEQFEHIVARQSEIKIRTVIKELSSRSLETRDFDELKKVVGDKPWIPISGRRAGDFPLVPTSRAVLVASRGDSPPFGFHELPSDISHQKFFRAMGCLESPSSAALIASLHDLADKGMEVKNRLQKIVILLEALADEKLSDEERAKVLVPDLIGTLHPIHKIVYNDISGPVLPPTDLRLAHSSIQLDLASKLQIPFLGHRQLGHIQNLAGSEMEETFKTKIRKTLKQYTDQQLLTEMLANALDAGASKFTVLLDERRQLSKSALLSPSMAQFYARPSLVIYNDAMFKEEDFKNVINGIGGKHDRTDTIGQFALGALTMFHVTDMPMIISGDKVLFLDSSDPNERHLVMLGGGPATILDWRRVASTYPDHFTSLEGLFGFSTKLNNYNATLFRLPLKEPHTSSWAMKKLIKPFEDRVEQCVLFTSIASIEVFRRRDDKLQSCFAIEANRQIDHDDGVFVSKQLTVRSRTNSGPREGSWRVVLGNDIEPLPEQYSSMHQTHRVRSPIVIGLAANITECQEHQRGTQKKSLFYSLPLPLQTTLPVHLTAPFILSEDRRNIRFESNYNIQEAKFNQWLLSELVPPLYFFLLEELTCRHRDLSAMNTWWPGRYDDDSITGMVTRSFFGKLRSTTRQVFVSSGTSPKLSPQEAIVSGREPSVITKLLSKLGTPNLAKFNREADFHLLGRLCSVLRTVDGELLRNEILRATAAFISWYDSDSGTRLISRISGIESIIQIITPLTAQEAGHPRLLEDLPLIPLLDGKLGCLSGDPNTLKYYYHFDPTCTRLLPADRLVHPDLSLCNQLSRKGLNILKLEPSAVRDLLHDRIPECEEGKCSVTAAEANLIRTFWDIYNKLPEDTIKELTSFSLLPITGGFYISIAYAHHPSVIFAVPEDEDWLLGCATALGALVIKREDIKPLPYNYIPEKGPLFKALLTFFRQSDLSTLRSKFVTLDPLLWSRFAEWCRMRLDNYVYNSDQSFWFVVKNLPIWEVYTPTTSTLDSVAGVSMLSSTIPSAPEKINFMSRFMNTKFTPFSGVLQRMKHLEINRDNLLWHLQLPDILNLRDVEPYKSLLRLALQGSYSGLVHVPNKNRVMRPTTLLYAHDPIFLAAFPDDYFCHQKLKEFERPSLHRHGLKVGSDLSVSLFTECARAFHDNLRNDPGTKMERAQTLFRIFCEDLPLHAGSQPVWGSLDSLCFIPSISDREQRSRWRNYISEHPTIASPTQVVCDNLAGIAWSQRTFFATAPHQRIFVGYPNFGEPTVREVVAHLQILASCGKTCTFESQLLRDLTETYRWLDQHSNEAKEFMLNHHGRPLFLNVVDPTKDIWTDNWIEADRLFFNLHCDTGDIYGVRRFLYDFPSLLRVSGVKELQDAQTPNISLSTNETILERQRNRFEEMRQNKELVDVTFVSSGKDFWAHRSFLATASDHFRSSFCSSGMEESRSASTSDPVVVQMTDYNSGTVESVLDYIYTGTEPNVTRSDDMNTDADIEGDALGRWFSIINLAQLWEVWGLFEIVQIRMIEGRMINPFTVREIREEAESLNATHLVDACKEYIRNNEEALRNVPSLEN